MDNSFFEYLQQLELLSFFSGYPLIYTIVFFVSGNIRSSLFSSEKITRLLPVVYAFTGLLYLGLLLKNLYPDYSFQNIRQNIHSPYLVLWGLLTILFFIPALRKKTVYSLFHSLIFFILLLKDILLYVFEKTTDKNILKNDMRIYTDSLLLNAALFLILSALFVLYKKTFTKKTG